MPESTAKLVLKAAWVRTLPQDCPHDKQPAQHAAVWLQIVLGVPERVSEVLKVQIAHFEPVLIAIRGEGVFPAVVLTLPRVEDAGFAAALRLAQEQHERTTAALRCGAAGTAMQSGAAAQQQIHEPHAHSATDCGKSGATS